MRLERASEVRQAAILKFPTGTPMASHSLFSEAPISPLSHFTDCISGVYVLSYLFFLVTHCFVLSVIVTQPARGEKMRRRIVVTATTTFLGASPDKPGTPLNTLCVLTHFMLSTACCGYSYCPNKKKDIKGKLNSELCWQDTGLRV